MSVMMKAITQVEWIKLRQLKLAGALWLPVVLSHGIVAFNALLQDLSLTELVDPGYQHVLMMNWYVFFMVFANFYLCFQYWRIELQDNCWNGLRLLPVNTSYILLVKLAYLSGLLLLQLLGLLLSSYGGAWLICQFCFYSFGELLVQLGLYWIVALPSIVVISLLILYLRRSEWIAGTSVVVMLVTIFTRDHELSVFNVWSWPYLVATERLSLTTAVVVEVSLLMIAILGYRWKVSQ